MYLRFFMLLTPLILMACGGSAEPEQALEERVAARWQHMIDRDFESAWDLYPPGFRRTTPQDDFARDLSRRDFRWLDASVMDWECSENRCDVQVEVTYQVTSGPRGISGMQMSRIINETWVNVDGRWWYGDG